MNIAWMNGNTIKNEPYKLGPSTKEREKGPKAP